MNRPLFYWRRLNNNFSLHTNAHALMQSCMPYEIPHIFINDYLHFICSGLYYEVESTQYILPSVQIDPNREIILRLSDDFYHTDFCTMLDDAIPYKCSIDITTRNSNMIGYINTDGILMER